MIFRTSLVALLCVLLALHAEGRSIAAHGNNTCALLPHGKMKCWGDNTKGQVGNGDADGTALTAPVEVLNISDATSIAVGDQFCCAVVADGEVKCWGDGSSGKLGDGSGSSSLSPVKVDVNTTSVALGRSHACALVEWWLDDEGYVHLWSVHASGPVYTGIVCWGDDGFGQLGNGDEFGSEDSPEGVSHLVRGVDSIIWLTHGRIQTAMSIAVGAHHSCVVLSDGKVLCWGLNFYGQVGDGTGVIKRESAFEVSGINATSVALGAAHSCALLTNGQVWCWGDNEFGQLGNTSVGTSANFPVFVASIGGNAASIALGDYHSCAVLLDGGVRCWGRNSFGQLGDGGNLDRSTPVAVYGFTESGTDRAESLALGSAHSCALLSTNTVKCWGRNAEGQLGDGTTTARFSPVAVSGLIFAYPPPPPLPPAPPLPSSPRLPSPPPPHIPFGRNEIIYTVAAGVLVYVIAHVLRVYFCLPDR